MQNSHGEMSVQKDKTRRAFLKDATTIDLAARRADVVGGFEAPPGTYAL